jgi:hypothetical protein
MTIRTAKMCLSLLWIGAIGPLLLILIYRQLSGFYDAPNTDHREVWNWVSQFVVPGATLLAGAWTVSVSSSDEKPVGNSWVFWVAVGMSVFYFVVLYLVVSVQASSQQPWPETFKQSALFLGIIQGAVIGVLGKFFIESAK